MTDIFTNTLNIPFPAGDVDETRNDLIKALSATVRWYAAYPEDYKGDDFNLALIAQLIESLSESK